MRERGRVGDRDRERTQEVKDRGKDKMVSGAKWLLSHKCWNWVKSAHVREES